MIRAHGGRLISRLAPQSDRAKLLEEATSLPALTLNRREFSDLALIANGAMSPLEGFQNQTEYDSVLERSRLSLGIPWTLPVVLTAKEGEINGLRAPFKAALQERNGTIIATIDVEDIYNVDKDREAEKVYLTTDDAHPGVKYIRALSNTYIGGKITLLKPLLDDPRFESYLLDPRETRVLFKTKGWERIVAFQTRNPIHRAHEYLQKCALEAVDGLLIHPIMGETKSDDIPAAVRMDCYLAMMNNYFPTDRVALSILPFAMRYAGPREAVFHAILRKNYGCTHFIVGRDHAGVGDYYGTYDAQNIFLQFEPGELEITPVNFDHSFFCKKCQGMASMKTCAHDKSERVFLSGTKVREMLASGEKLPDEFTRREVAEILESHYGSVSKTA
ncbi:MAG: sulfate adenylyltransferase [bacterium]|nr:sulfate adenylyltransferase [bacterium]